MIYVEKVKKRRAELGLTDLEVSKRMGFEDYGSYQDIEFNDDEITDFWDIVNVKSLFRILNFDYFEFFDSKCAFCELGEKYLEEYKLPRNELLIKKRLELGLSQADFADKAGWEIELLEEKDNEFEKFSIMAMNDIAAVINVPIQILVGVKCSKCGR